VGGLPATELQRRRTSDDSSALIGRVWYPPAGSVTDVDLRDSSYFESSL